MAYAGCPGRDAAKVFRNGPHECSETAHAAARSALVILLPSHERRLFTQHLDVLEAANLIAAVRRGREKLHFLNPVPLQEIYERWIANFEKPRLTTLSDLERRLEKTHG